MLLRNEEVLLRVNEQTNILHEIRKRKANCFGHILRRNCLLKQVTEGKIKGEMEVARRRGRRRKKLLDDLKDRRGYSHLKEEALHRTIWRHRFGGGFGPVVRQNTEWMNEKSISWCVKFSAPLSCYMLTVQNLRQITTLYKVLGLPCLLHCNCTILIWFCHFNPDDWSCSTNVARVNLTPSYYIIRTSTGGKRQIFLAAWTVYIQPGWNLCD